MDASRKRSVWKRCGVQGGCSDRTPVSDSRGGGEYADGNVLGVCTTGAWNSGISIGVLVAAIQLIDN